MGVISLSHSLLEKPRDLGALESKVLTVLDIIIVTTRKHWWTQFYLKSELTYCLFPCFSTDFLSSRWIKNLDVWIKAENWHVLLTINNFSGHSIDYESTNIQIKFFEPNMILFVQPLDIEIICCFKAHCWKQFCYCAVELNELGECKIFNIDLKEAIEMAMEA